MNMAKCNKANEDTRGKVFTMQEALSQTERWMCYWMLFRSDTPPEMFMAFEEYVMGLPE